MTCAPERHHPDHHSVLESQAGFSYPQAVTAVSCALSSNVGGSMGS